MFDMEPFGDKRVPGTDVGLANKLREYSPDSGGGNSLLSGRTYKITLPCNKASRTSIGGHKDIWTGLEDWNDI